MKSRIQNQRGFSLVEVLIAITLLAIGLLGVAGMQTTAISGNAFAQTGTVARALAEEMVDRVRTNAGTSPVNYHALNTQNACGGSDPVLTDCTQWKTRLQASGLQNIYGTVNVTPNSPIDNTATVTVEVLWGPNGDDRKVTISTIVETWGT